MAGQVDYLFGRSERGMLCGSGWVAGWLAGRLVGVEAELYQRSHMFVQSGVDNLDRWLLLRGHEGSVDIKYVAGGG